MSWRILLIDSEVCNSSDGTLRPGSGVRVQGSEFRVQGSGFGVWGYVPAW